MDHRLIEGLMEVIVPAVREYVDGALSKATAPLLSRIAELESRPAQRGEPGEPGKSVTLDDVRPIILEAVDALPKAKDGTSITIDDVRPLILEEVAKIPAPENGRSVTVDDVRPVLEDMLEALPKAKDGADADPALLCRMVDEAVARLPAAKDGTSITLDDVRPLIEEAVAKLPPAERGPSGVGLASAVIDREGVLVLTLSDGSTKELGVVVGKDADRDAIAAAIAEEVAKFPKPKDGLGFDDLSVDFDGERTFTLRFVRGDQTKEFPFDLALPLDRGVWKEGDWKKGDGVTWNGSWFIAQKDTSEKPEVSRDWRLAVKRGRDGRNGKDGEPGQRGPEGPRGRDLTQLSFAGEKT
jgi:hypothetical protein